MQNNQQTHEEKRYTRVTHHPLYSYLWIQDVGYLVFLSLSFEHNLLLEGLKVVPTQYFWRLPTQQDLLEFQKHFQTMVLLLSINLLDRYSSQDLLWDDPNHLLKLGQSKALLLGTMVLLGQNTVCLCHRIIPLHHQRNRTNLMSFLDPCWVTLQRDIQGDRCLHRHEMLRPSRQNDFAAFVSTVSWECQDHTPTSMKTCLYDGGVSNPPVDFLVRVGSNGVRIPRPPPKPIGFWAS